MADVAGEPPRKRQLPRFETVMVVLGGRQRFFAYDHVSRSARFPLDPFSRPQADALRDLMTTDARNRKEPLSTFRLESAVNGPPKPEPKSKPKTTNRHAPQARSH